MYSLFDLFLIDIRVIHTLLLIHTLLIILRLNIITQLFFIIEVFLIVLFLKFLVLQLIPLGSQVAIMQPVPLLPQVKMGMGNKQNVESKNEKTLGLRQTVYYVKQNMEFILYFPFSGGYSTMSRKAGLITPSTWEDRCHNSKSFPSCSFLPSFYC